MKLSETERKQAVEMVYRGLALSQLNMDRAGNKDDYNIAKACYEAFKCLWDALQN